MDLTRIKDDIPKEVYDYAQENASNKRGFYISFLQARYGEIVERVFASQRFKHEGVKIKEVLRRTTGNAKTIARNLVVNNVYGGWYPVYDKRDKYAHAGGYPYKVFGVEDYDVWYTIDTVPGICKVTLNPELVKTMARYRYSGYSGGDAISYLKAYKEDHRIELFGKSGLPISKKIMSMIERDRQFRVFALKNAAAIGLYGVQAAMYAYKHKVSVEEARRICSVKNANDRMCSIYLPALVGKKVDKTRIIDYCDENGIDYTRYNDYIDAAIALGYDLKDTKTVYPHDFDRMHELRTAEHAAKKALLDEKKKQELFDRVRRAGERAKSRAFKKGAYIIVPAMSVQDLIDEGKALEHCVGRMGYDKRIADGISLIMFVRRRSEPDVPFVTVEYKLKEKRVTQVYGKHDSRPADDVKAFVDEWEARQRKAV